MTDSTPRLNLPLVGDHSQKRIVMNAGLMRLESLVQAAVQSRTVAAQPLTPTDGDAYILPTGKTGSAWIAFADGDFVRYDSHLWEVIAFPDGAVVHIGDENRFVVRSAGGWMAFEDAIRSLDNLSRLGINTTADATNVLALKGPAALLSAREASAGGSGDISVSINKETATDTAQILLQTGFSSRAILGLLGDDSLTLKVSPDGSSFVTALKVNAATGAALLATGSVSAPALALGAAGQGFNGAGHLSMSFASVERMRTTATGTSFYSPGSATRPDPASAVELVGDDASGTSLQVMSSSGCVIQQSRFSSDNGSPNWRTAKAGGSLSAPAVVASSDRVGIFQFTAYDGVSTYREVGIWETYVTATTPGPTSMTGQFRFSLVNSGVTRTEVMRMDVASGLSMYGANPVIDQNRNHRLRVYTVATLPAANTAVGQLAMVSDASTPTFAAVVSAGGATCVPVYSDGTNWRTG